MFNGRKIFDCVLFHNEVELLKLRFLELASVVDCFVIVEGDKTFSGKRKQLLFNREDYPEGLKIIYIAVRDMPEGKDKWEREYWQRNAILRGLKGCHPEDIVLISDADEIPRWEELKRLTIEWMPMVFHQRMSCYYLNCLSNEDWCGTTMCLFKQLKSPQKLRNRRWDLAKIEHGGWHFSYLGGAGRIQEKIRAFSHSEFNKRPFTNKKHINESIAGMKDLFDRKRVYKRRTPDVSFLPKVVMDNLENFRELLI